MRTTRPSLTQRVLRSIRAGVEAFSTLPSPPPASKNSRAPQGDAGFRWGPNGRGGQRHQSPLPWNPDVSTPELAAIAYAGVLIDPKVRQAAGIRIARMAGATWRAVPRDKSDGAQEAAALVNEGLGWGQWAKSGGHLLPERRWPILAAQGMTSYLTGVSLGEAVPSDGPGPVWLKDIEPRHHGNILGWQRGPRGRVVGVTMRRSDVWNREYTMPIGDPRGGCWHIPYSMVGDPEGVDLALLRPVIKLVSIKRKAFAEIEKGLGLWTTPIPQAEVMYGLARAQQLEDGEIAEAWSEAKAGIAAFMRGELAGLVGSDIVKVSPWGGTFNPSGAVEVTNLIDHQILSTLDAAWLVMGVSAAFGSHRASKAQGDVGVLAASNMCDHFAGYVEAGPASWLVNWNIPGAPVPHIVHSGLDVMGLADHLGILGHLAAGGFLAADGSIPAELRRAVQEILGLPMEPDGGPASTPGQVPSLGNPGAPGPGRGNPGPTDPDQTRRQAEEIAAFLGEHILRAALQTRPT